MKDEEAIVKGIIEALLPGAVMQYQEEQSNGVHDSTWFTRADNVPLEVTISADKNYDLDMAMDELGDRLEKEVKTYASVD